MTDKSQTLTKEEALNLIGDDVPSHPCSRCSDKDGLSKTECINCVKADAVNFTKKQIRKRIINYGKETREQKPERCCEKCRNTVGILEVCLNLDCRCHNVGNENN